MAARGLEDCEGGWKTGSDDFSEKLEMSYD